MTDQYTEISFNAGETLRASQLNTVVQNINIVNTQVENINNSITEINNTKADKPAENENYATETYVNTKVADLVNSAPETLNTLNELAAALGDDPNFATTIVSELGNKVDKTTTINDKALTNNITLTAADVKALPDTTVIPSIAGLATEDYVNTKTAAITVNTLGAAKASDLTTLQTNLATLQTNFANLQTSLNLSVGTSGQFAVSNGSGGITWLEIPNAEDTTY